MSVLLIFLMIFLAVSGWVDRHLNQVETWIFIGVLISLSVNELLRGRGFRQ